MIPWGYMIQTIPIKETRDQLAELINLVDVAGKSFVITKFGKPKAMLVPMQSALTKASVKPLPSFGAWKDRTDIGDSEEWVRTIRKKMSSRYEK